jgi:signal peptidase II
MSIEKKLFVMRYGLCVTGFIILDQITKLIFTRLGRRDFFIGLLHIHPVKNYGLAFALNFGLLPNLILVSLGLLFFVYYFFIHQQEFYGARRTVFILVFAGALSNIIDRLYLGYVRDFVDLGLGFTFNLADVFVIAGLLLILWPDIWDGDKIVN